MAQQPMMTQQQMPSGMKEGDWICDACGDHQFARNASCRRCNAPRPAAAGKGGGKMQMMQEQQMMEMMMDSMMGGGMMGGGKMGGGRMGGGMMGGGGMRGGGMM